MTEQQQEQVLSSAEVILSTVLNSVANQGTPEHIHIIRAFGLRSPASAGQGNWDGAFVFVRADGGVVQAGEFAEGLDWIHGGSAREKQVWAGTRYTELALAGWTPMTRGDLEETAGLHLTEDSDTRPYDPTADAPSLLSACVVC